MQNLPRILLQEVINFSRPPSVIAPSILFLIGLTTVVAACHQSANPAPGLLGIPGTDETEPRMEVDQAQLRVWIAASDFDKVDALLAQRQADYRAGKLGDVGLRNVFNVFTRPDPALGAFVDAWVIKFPRSYVARLARGVFYRSLGEQQRGGDWNSNTPDYKFDQMRDSFGIAFGDLQSSLALDDKPIVSYMYLISVGKHVKDLAFTRRQLDAAVRLDPKNFIVRRVFLRMLRPRWKGSMPEMEAFLNECRKAQLPPSQISELEALVQVEYAWQAEQTSNWPVAVERYASASKAFPHTNLELWNGYGHAAFQLPTPQRCAIAMPVLENLETLRGYGDQPAANRAWVHSSRAFCFGQSHNQPAAIAEARIAADLGDAWAQTELGEVLWHGSALPKDEKAATELWQKAAASGDERAAKLLKGIHEHP